MPSEPVLVQAAKPEIKLTPGKGVQDLTVPLRDIIQQVVSSNKVRAARQASADVVCLVSLFNTSQVWAKYPPRRVPHCRWNLQLPLLGSTNSWLHVSVSCPETIHAESHRAHLRHAVHAQVVAFIKGTRTQPQCGFSHRVLTLLNESRLPYEVVNVLDDVHNPGLREEIKVFSQWPTVPQASFTAGCLSAQATDAGSCTSIEESNRAALQLCSAAEVASADHAALHSCMQELWHAPHATFPAQMQSHLCEQLHKESAAASAARCTLAECAAASCGCSAGVHQRRVCWRR